MNGSDFIRSLYAYHTWANERIFATAAQLTPEQFVADTQMSVGSLRDVLLHLVAAERSWLARVRDEQPPAPLSAQEFASAADLAAAWRQLNATTQATVGQLHDEALSQSVQFIGRTGEPVTRTRWQMLMHQANHAGQHRAEVALILSQLGHSPGDIDYFRYVDAG